jgi:hypothetical protein
MCEKLKWQMYERLGVPVYYHEPEVHGEPIDVSKLRPVLEKDGAGVGTKVLVNGLFGEFIPMTIYEHGAVSEGKMVASLSYDEEGELVATGLFNMAALKRLELSTGAEDGSTSKD